MNTLPKSQARQITNLNYTKMSIQVNLTRALERISLKAKQGKYVYGLFIDFSNAYNSIPHCLLFQKLKSQKVLE